MLRRPRDTKTEVVVEAHLVDANPNTHVIVPPAVLRAITHGKITRITRVTDLIPQQILPRDAGLTGTGTNDNNSHPNQWK